MVWTDSVFIIQYTLLEYSFFSSVTCLPQNEVLNTHVFGRLFHKFLKFVVWTDSVFITQYNLLEYSFFSSGTCFPQNDVWALNGNWIGNPLVPSAAPWPSDPVSPINIIYAAEHFILCTKCIHDNLKPKEVAKLILILQMH